MSQVTKRALEASLKKLRCERLLDKITVTDIAEDCGINRMTFYYHFRDIYDLVEWACQGGRPADTGWQAHLYHLAGGVPPDSDGPIDNRPFILNVYRSVRREQVETSLFQVTHGLPMGVVEELDPGERCEEGQGLSGRLLQVRLCGAGSGLDPHRHEGESDGAGPPGRAGGFGQLCPGAGAPGRIPPIRRARLIKIETEGPGDETSITGAPLLIAPPFRRGYTGPRIQSNAMKRRHFHVLFQRQLRGLCPPGEAGGRGA